MTCMALYKLVCPYLDNDVINCNVVKLLYTVIPYTYDKTSEGNFFVILMDIANGE